MGFSVSTLGPPVSRRQIFPQLTMGIDMFANILRARLAWECANTMALFAGSVDKVKPEAQAIRSGKKVSP